MVSTLTRKLGISRELILKFAYNNMYSIALTAPVQKIHKSLKVLKIS